MKKIAFKIFLVLVAACHGPALPAVPSKGGPAWFELESDHFTVWTDASQGRAKELVREMEHLRQVVLGVGFTGTRVEGRSLVIALRDREEVNVFVPEQFTAFASDAFVIHQPLMVLPAETEHDPTVTHELVHVISFHAIRNQPAWFAEGMANFFASVNLDPEKSRGEFGSPLPNIAAQLRVHPPRPTAQMFACEEPGCKDESFYVTAWAMFAFLANQYPKELLQYAARLDELPYEKMQQAFVDVFPKLTPENFDHEMRKWLAYGKHTVWTFNVALHEWHMRQRALSDADVYASRALIRQLWRKVGDPTPPELQLALAADPTHLIANFVSYSYTKTIAPELAARIAQAHPDDWRAWYLVGVAADWKGDEAMHAKETACALLAKHPSSSAPNGLCE